MNDPKEPLLLDHEYDGIQELDNNLPRWWVWLFYLTIAFSAGYLLYYHVFRLGDLQIAAYQKEFERGEAIKQSFQAKFEAQVESLAPLTDPESLGRGHQTYITYCAPCHREDGGGLVGPNLTDDYWIHGGSYVDTVKIILNGVPDKGMLAWRGVLQPAEIAAVASHIYTLRGTEPPNPKPREDQAPAAGPNEFE
ncbi:MAG TPA: cbb3-type cytochrome c oxidase N-terminal domain-containing protein [Verrucomicrobiota bacterium]|nr:cbb3-type cytochrome c oxidase N-terminal domain-containing protein [Verrucomicrobiota bacterium]